MEIYCPSHYDGDIIAQALHSSHTNSIKSLIGTSKCLLVFADNITVVVSVGISIESEVIKIIVQIKL